MKIVLFPFFPSPSIPLHPPPFLIGRIKSHAMDAMRYAVYTFPFLIGRIKRLAAQRGALEESAFPFLIGRIKRDTW